MGVFNDVTLTWGEVSYPIPSNRVMGCIETIEDVITLSEVMAMQARGPKVAKIARAFAAALSYSAGLVENRALNLAKVTQESVFQGMFNGESAQQNVVDSLSTLLLMMVPPSVYAEAEKRAGEAAPATQGNVPNRRARRASASSKKPSK